MVVNGQTRTDSETLDTLYLVKPKSEKCYLETVYVEGCVDILSRAGGGVV